jgi:hypothetical protein
LSNVEDLPQARHAVYFGLGAIPSSTFKKQIRRTLGPPLTSAVAKVTVLVL